MPTKKRAAKKKASRKKASKPQLLQKKISKFVVKQLKYLDHHKALQISLGASTFFIVLIWGVPFIMNVLSATGAVDAKAAEAAEKLYMDNLQEAVRKVPQAATKAKEGAASLIDYVANNYQAIATFLLIVIPNGIILWRKALGKQNG